MIKSIEVSAKTEDEAIETALEQLGLARDDVSVEIVERAKTGFLGLKNTPAVVKVVYDAKGDRMELVENFLAGLFVRMDIDVNIDVAEEDGSVNVVLTSKDPGALIGRRGETLDSIQHLANYVVNRGGSNRIRVNLDAENYRQRRNETLENLAARTAGKVMKYRRNMTLDPMNAYERHVIHSALQNYENISTYSIGNEPNRRIVVAYGRSSEGGGRDGAGRPGDRTSRSGDGGGRNRDGGGRSADRGRRSSAGSAGSTGTAGIGGTSGTSGAETGAKFEDENNDRGRPESAERSETAPQYREWS